MSARIAVASGVLFLFAAVPHVAGATLADGLIGYWQFDGGGADSSTLGNDLTIYGGAGFADGLFGQALDLHGDPSQYAARPGDDQIYDFGSSDFTVQAWVDYSVLGEIGQVLVEKFTGPTGGGWTAYKGQDGDRLEFFSWPSANFGSASSLLTANEWRQVVIRRSDDRFDLLLNATIVATATDSDPISDTNAPLLVGEREGDQQFPAYGRIDEVAIWNRALSDAEIAYLYNGGAGNPVLPPPEPVTRRVPIEYPTIQAAIDASFDGDTVLVAPGIHEIAEPVYVSGKAVALISSDGADATQIRMSVTPSNPSRASVMLLEGQTGATVIEGFTIAGGIGTDTGDATYEGGNGGGILCVRGASATMRSCKIQGNWAEVRGGGVSCYGQATLRLVDCTITGNVSAAAGAGIHCVDSVAEIVNCLISGNTALGQGGGGIVCSACIASIRGCSVIGNHSYKRGAGVFLSGESPTEMTNCIIIGNSTENVGGGVCTDSFSPIVSNCTISMNSAAGGGGGIACKHASSPIVRNCVIWGNTPDTILAIEESVPSVAYSCTDDAEPWPGDSNLSAAPLFIRPAVVDFNRFSTQPIGGNSYEVPDFVVDAGDYHLQPTSPCVDAGGVENAPNGDLDGNPRPCRAGYDIGAYEYCPATQLALVSAHVAECASAHVFVALTNSYPVQAFSFGIAHDPVIATLAAIDYVDCPVLQALNAGNGPDYFGVDVDAGIVHCPESISAGGTVYCIASQTAPSTESIPAGDDQPIARLTYEVVPGNAPDTQSAISIVGCLGDELPREIVVTVDGFSVIPEVAMGILTIGPPACGFIRGDVNRDGRMDISDVVSMLMYMFEQGRGPLRCEDAADANDDGALDIGDAVRILARLFADGAAFDPPYPGCGTDPTLDRLQCGMSACQ